MKGYAMLGIGKTGFIEKEKPHCGPLDAVVRPIAVSPCTSDIHTVYEGALGDASYGKRGALQCNLGRALLHHAEFKARGFNIVGAFDCDPFKIGEQVYGLEVTCTSDLKSAVDAKGIEIGIITTPPERAQRAADHLVEAGVCGILNFAGARIHVPEKVVVEYVDFFHYLYALAFSITGSEHRSK